VKPNDGLDSKKRGTKNGKKRKVRDVARVDV
jgi:hypothetical protein